MNTMTLHAFKLAVAGMAAALTLTGCGGGGDTGPAFAQNLASEVQVLRNINGQETATYVSDCFFDSNSRVHFRQQFSLSRTSNAEQLIRTSADVLYGADSTCAQAGRVKAIFYPQEILIASGPRTLATGEVVQGYSVVDPGGNVVTYDFTTAQATVTEVIRPGSSLDIVFFGTDSSTGVATIKVGDTSATDAEGYPDSLLPDEFKLAPPAVIPGST